jgi:uncharacterized protein (TIGR02646 family)
MDRGAQWTAEYLECLSRGEVPPASIRYCYRHPDIKAAIKRDTYGKCAYCEAKPTANQPGDIEHIRPVSLNPALISEWTNLTLVCRTCNQSKGAYDDPGAPLIDPHVDDPEELVLFAGPWATCRPGDFLAYRTIKKIKLNRAELIEARAEALDRLMHMLMLREHAPDASTREVIEEEAFQLAAADQEFAAVIRSYIRLTNTVATASDSSNAPA